MAQPALQQSQPSSAGAKVTVASKMPNGLIMRRFEERTEQELVQGGGVRDVKVSRPTGESVTILGTTVRVGQVPPLLFGGYRLTPGVPKDLWDQWRAANRDSEMVRGKLVIAHEDTQRIKDEAEELVSVKTGLEGIDPSEPGKAVRSNIQRMDPPKR